MRESCRQGILGVVFALDAETRGLRRVLSHSQRVRCAPGQTAWHFGGARIIMEVAGVGREPARLVTNRLIDQGARWIVCAGFAAALEEKARAGDVVVAESVRHIESPTSEHQCSLSLASAIPPSRRLGYSVWRADFVTVDSVVLKADSKRKIYASTRCAALDMESSAVGEVCSHRSVPFVVVKGITDTADQDLPDQIETLIGTARWTERAGLVLSRPRLWRELWQLRRNALIASDNLGDVLGMMILRLFA